MDHNEDLGKIKDRIAKLLRMADDSSSPNEAAIAAGRARKLMDQYQLGAIDINGEISESLVARDHGRFFAAIPLYLQYFAVSIAKYNDCQVRFEWGDVTFKKRQGERLKQGKRPCFQGYQSDVDLACEMYDRLEAAVNRLCKVYMDGLGLPKYSVKIGGAFKHGAIDEIRRRINSMLTEREALFQESSGKGLMVIKSAAVEERFGAPNYSEGKKVVVTDHETAQAHSQGRELAKRIEINPLVN